MKDVVLINPPQFELKQPAAYIPLGLAYLAAALESKGFDVEVVNLAKDDTKTIPKADWTGITCTSATYEHVKVLAWKLHSYPGKLIIGGPHASVSPEETLRIFQTDAVIQGEAELLFPQLVVGERRFERIMDAGIIRDLDALPFPARHLFDEDCVVDRSGIHGQEKGVPATTVISSRGCPYRCRFCCKGHEMFRAYRFRSAKNVKHELQQLIDVYGVEHVRFVDDEFTLNRKRTLKLCRAIRDLEISWVCITRADSLDAEMLKAMKKARCVEVHVGVEYGSDPLLELMNKQTSAADLLKGIQMIKTAGIRAKTYLMYGYPGETEADREATLRFLAQAKPDKFTLSKFTALPGSEVARARVGSNPALSWFYPDEQDHKYFEYKEQIREVIKNG